MAEPLSTTLVLTLGSSITKTLLRTWVGSNSVAGEVETSFTDMLRSKISDELMQRRAQRQFEEIGERIATDLQPLFADASLSDNGKRAVALEVAQTLARADITPQALAALDLEATRVAHELIPTGSAKPVGFSEAEEQLYTRTLVAAASDIVDIASRLPTFSERTLSELLQRDRTIINLANDVLREVRALRREVQALNLSADASQLEEQYRRAIARGLDELQLFGLPNLSRASRRHSLTIAYISLSIALAPRSSEPSERRSMELPPTENHRTDASDLTGAGEALEATLRRTGRLLIRGQAGSGKTTLLKWLAVKVATHSFGEDSPRLANAIPFYIPLRACIESGLPSPRDFPRFVAPTMADTIPPAWVHEHLRSGRALILIDSVDEVPQLERDNVRAWLRDLCAEYPRAAFIVTSRPPAIEEGWLDDQSFWDAELLPMTSDDIQVFIDHWHSAVADRLQEADDMAGLLALASRLKQAVTQTKSLQLLATNPLLCAALCALHRDRNRTLPTDRVQLYTELCQMLIEERAAEQQLVVETLDYPKLSYRQKTTLLRKLAYWMIINRYTSVSRRDAESYLADQLLTMTNLPEDTEANLVLRLFLERSGMLREPVVDRIDFAHRTLQEFLAAQSSIENHDLGVLVEHAHDDQWSEVIILACGLAAQRDADTLVLSILERGDKEPTSRHQLHLLAVACLESTIALDQQIRAEVNTRLKKLVPPRNMTEARAISAAGEIAIPYLRSNQRLNANQAAACIRALSLIGGPEALNALAGFARDMREKPQAELLRSAESFDQEEYFRLVRSTMPHSWLTMVNPPSLLGIGYLKNVKTLHLTRVREIVDLSPLAEATSINTLRIELAEGIVDLRALDEMSHIIEVDVALSRDKIAVLDALNRNRHIERLGIYAADAEFIDMACVREARKLSTLIMLCPELRRFAGLTGVVVDSVTCLVLIGGEQSHDVDFLQSFPNLRELFLVGFSAVESMAELRGLPALETLVLIGFDSIRSIEFVNDLAMLRSFILCGLSSVEDLRPLRSFPEPLRFYTDHTSLGSARLRARAPEMYGSMLIPVIAPLWHRSSVNAGFGIRVGGKSSYLLLLSPFGDNRFWDDARLVGTLGFWRKFVDDAFQRIGFEARRYRRALRESDAVGVVGAVDAVERKLVGDRLYFVM